MVHQAQGPLVLQLAGRCESFMCSFPIYIYEEYGEGSETDVEGVGHVVLEEQHGEREGDQEEDDREPWLLPEHGKQGEEEAEEDGGGDHWGVPFHGNHCWVAGPFQAGGPR